MTEWKRLSSNLLFLYSLSLIFVFFFLQENELGIWRSDFCCCWSNVCWFRCQESCMGCWSHVHYITRHCVLVFSNINRISSFLIALMVIYKRIFANFVVSWCMHIFLHWMSLRWLCNSVFSLPSLCLLELVGYFCFCGWRWLLVQWLSFLAPSKVMDLKNRS